MTRRYWRHHKAGVKTFRSQWTKGSTWDLEHPEVGLVVSDPEQVILESSTVPALTKAIEAALSIGATGSDAIALILFHHAEQPVGLFSLDGHPHLKSVAIEAPDLTAYRALTATG